MNNKQEIIQEIIRVANAISPAPLTQQAFKQHSNIPLSRIRYHFGSFNKAITSAGLNPNVPSVKVSGYKTLSEEELFSAIGDLWRKIGKKPTESAMNAEGEYSIKPYRDRWGTFSKAVDEYYARFGEPEFAPELSKSTETLSQPKQRQIVIPKTHKPKSGQNNIARVLYGEPLDFRGLRYAPINEQGVVYLFGMVSRELGFLIESIRTDYPDCEGKRYLELIRK
jgi:hypothetical protein